MRFLAVPLLAAILMPVLSPAYAQTADQPVTIVIKDHKFEPAELKVPAGKKLTLLVDNQDATSEEFESNELKVEKIVGGKKQIKVNVGPLKPGTYKFFGEFHEKTAQGVLIAE